MLFPKHAQSGNKMKPVCLLSLPLASIDCRDGAIKHWAVGLTAGQGVATQAVGCPPKRAGRARHDPWLIWQVPALQAVGA